MKPLSIVVLQGETGHTQSLASSLYNHFRVVNVAHNVNELRSAISQHRADVAIVDLEFAPLDDVQRICREFAGTSVVCTHRLADEKMWGQALAAGAIDCCSSFDVRAIVLAAINTPPVSHYHAA
jgi:AmiR/NasT family two-component response regulator